MAFQREGRKSLKLERQISRAGMVKDSSQNCVWDASDESIGTYHLKDALEETLPGPCSFASFDVSLKVS